MEPGFDGQPGGFDVLILYLLDLVVRDQRMIGRHAGLTIESLMVRGDDAVRNAEPARVGQLQHFQ